MAIERLTIANYDNLENKPIAAKNLATETVEDNNYYLNKAAEKLVYTENPTNPNGSTIDKIYYNMNMSVDDVGQSLIDMPWDDAVVSEVDGMSLKFLQLIGADTAENGGKGIYVTKIPNPGLGDLYYIIAGVSNFDSEPQLLFQYSADFGPHDMDSGVDAWGWMLHETFELATKSPISLLEGYTFTFNYMTNKECWDTWFSTSNEFASSFDFEANTLYKRVGNAYKKIDGNVLEPVDKLPQPTEALKGRVVYNKKDNQIYECKEITGGITETPISYESLLPTSCEWDSCSANTYFFINDSIDTDIVKIIFADKDSGTLVTAYDSCSTGSAYVSYQHSGNELQIIDYTDSCSPRTIFDSAAGGWQISTENGWYPTEDGKYDYPRYSLKSDFYKYRLNLNEREAPIGCLFSQYGTFAGYNLVDGVYLNVHDKFDGTKMFADSSQPMLQVITHDIDKQVKYGLMFVLLDAFGPAGGWSILLQDWETEQIYPLYAEKAFEWSDASVTVTTPGWQSEYVDLTTGKLKVSKDGVISDIGRTLMYLPGEMGVTEDLLGDYIAGAPFTQVEGVYKWSNLAKSGEETFKLSGNNYRIIQHTSMEPLTLTENNGAENVIILGTIDGTLTIESGAVKQLTYIGYCSHLTIDLRSWPVYSSSDYPVINLIGDGTATIYGSRMAVTATDSLIVEESNDGTSAYKWCNIKAGKNISYKFNVGNKAYRTQQPARFECDELTIENLSGDTSSVCRLIDAHCNFLTINGSKTFLENSFNKNGSAGMGSELIIHAPSLSRAGGDNCTAARYAGPASDLGGYHLFAEPDTCNPSVYNRTWKTIQEYVDSKAAGGSSRLTKRTQQYASGWYSDGSGGYKCTFYTTEQNSDLVFISTASNSPSLYGVYGASKSGTTIYLHSDSSSVTSGPSLLFNITIVPCEENSYGAVFYKDENAENTDESGSVDYDTAYDIAAANRVICTGGMTEFWDTSSSWNTVYLNKYFPYTFEHSTAISTTLLHIGYNSSGETLKLDYDPADPSALSIYIYDASGGSNMSGAVESILFENGKWLINPSVGSSGSWYIPLSMDATAKKVAEQLLSWTGWTYIPLNCVSDNFITHVDNSSWIDTTNQQLYLSGKLIEVKAVVTHEDGSKTQYLTGILKVPSDYIPGGQDNARSSTTLVVNGIKVGTDIMGMAFFDGVDGATYYYRLIQ